VEQLDLEAVACSKQWETKVHQCDR